MVYTHSKIESNHESQVPTCPQDWKAEFKSVSTQCDKMASKGESQFGDTEDAVW